MAEKKKVAVISDTHGLLRKEVVEILSGCERILHCGDIDRQEILDELRQIVPVTAVRGNVDGEWADYLPQEASFTLYGRKICMIHNKKHLSEKAKEADVILYGHTHKYHEKTADGKLWLNPGSCGPQRFGQPVTMAVLKFDPDSLAVKVKRIDLTEGTAVSSANGVNDPAYGMGKMGEGSSSMIDQELATILASGKLNSLVEKTVKDLQRGKSIERIEEKRGISHALAAQIAQIYFTHPGIDAQGVLNKMEIAGR